MRRLSFLAAAAAVIAAGSCPTAAADGKLGARTVPPEQLLPEAGDDGELERAVAAAAAHPLGTLANPVRVGGPDGARLYVARLRCADGSAPKAGPSRPGGVGAYGTVVELHPLDCGDALPGRFDLMVDLYHEEHREDRAPAGFRIGPR